MTIPRLLAVLKRQSHATIIMAGVLCLEAGKGGGGARGAAQGGGESRGKTACVLCVCVCVEGGRLLLLTGDKHRWERCSAGELAQARLDQTPVLSRLGVAAVDALR